MATTTQVRQPIHVVLAQGEVEYIDVVRQSLPPSRLRYRDQAELDMPAKHDLSRCPAVGSGDFADDRVAEQPATFPDRRPRLGDDAMGGVVLRSGTTGHERVELDLVDMRGDTSLLVAKSVWRRLAVAAGGMLGALAAVVFMAQLHLFAHL